MGPPPMATATSRPPAPMASMPSPPEVGGGLSEARRGWRGARGGLAGDAEALQVHLVADAVARPREVDAVLGGHALKEAVVVGVLEAGLEHVVVDVTHGQFCADAGDAHGLELEVGHGARGVLGEGLGAPDG